MSSGNPAISTCATDGIHVKVESRYLPDQIPADLEERLFGYRITITNERDEVVRLLRRHWTIIDADGGEQVINGAGVIGQQPLIEAGKSYTYGSFCPLSTDWGTMEGYFLMQDADGGLFRVTIARFHLFVPLEVGV